MVLCGRGDLSTGIWQGSLRTVLYTICWLRGCPWQDKQCCSSLCSLARKVDFTLETDSGIPQWIVIGAWAYPLILMKRGRLYWKFKEECSISSSKVRFENSQTCHFYLWKNLVLCSSWQFASSDPWGAAEERSSVSEREALWEKGLQFLGLLECQEEFCVVHDPTGVL